MQLLAALQKFGNSLDEYLHLVLPPMVRLFDATDCSIQVSFNDVGNLVFNFSSHLFYFYFDVLW